MENSDSLDKIEATVHERAKKIIENEAYSACIKKATEKLKSEIDRLNKEKEEMEKEDKMLMEQVGDLDKSIEIQKQTLHTSEQSLLMHQSYKENLKQQVQEMKNKYAATLEEYNKEYQEYRAIYENESENYKDLRAREIELKKLEFQQMALKAKNRQLVKIKNEFDEIQRKRRNASIVEFATFCLEYYENEAVEKKLAELKKEEQRLIREHLELAEKLKEKQKMCKEKNYAEDKSPVVELPEERKEKAPADMIKKFLSDEFQPFSLTSVEPTIKPVLNKDASKVQVLDVKVVKLLPSTSTQALREKMENIVETTRKDVLKSYSQSATPVSSQESLEKQSQEKKSKDVSTGVSQNMASLNLNEKVVAPILKAKEDTVSKFFKKKTVTFKTHEKKSETSRKQNRAGLQNENKDKTLQRAGNKSMDIFRKPFALNKDNPQEERNAFLPKQPLFGILNKSNTSPQSQTGLGKENKFSGPTSMDIFKRPFAFNKATPLKQEQKNFFQKPSVGILNKTTPTPESEVGSSMSTNLSFIGPSSFGTQDGDQKMRDESFSDPFSPPIDDGAQALSEPSTFNLFGSNNNSSLFNMW